MLELHGMPQPMCMPKMKHAACHSASCACRWIIQDALKVAAHALLMRFNVFGVRTWDAGKAGVDGRLLGVRVRADLLEASSTPKCVAAKSSLTCLPQKLL